MAETKTTKPKAAKPKTVKENEKINDGEEKFLKEEAIENEVEASEPEDACNANCEAYLNGEPAEDQPVVDEPEPESAEETQNPAEEPITAENVAEKIAEEVSAINSATEKELSDFYEHLDDAVKEAQNAEPEKVAEVASKKLNELEEIEKRLEDELDKEVEALSATQRKAADKLFGRGFGEFWNGVSTGWEN